MTLASVGWYLEINVHTILLCSVTLTRVWTTYISNYSIRHSYTFKISLHLRPCHVSQKYCKACVLCLLGERAFTTTIIPPETNLNSEKSYLQPSSYSSGLYRNSYHLSQQDLGTLKYLLSGLQVPVSIQGLCVRLAISLAHNIPSFPLQQRCSFVSIG